MKRPLKALLPIFLAALFLLNALTVLAAEADKVPPDESQTIGESVTDSGRPAPPDEPEPVEIPGKGPSDNSEDGAELPENDAAEEPPPVWLEVETFEALNEALGASIPAETTRIRLMNSITVPAIEERCVSGPDHPVTLDLGPHTLYIEGGLVFQDGLILTGSAGVDALIRVRPGGEAYIKNVTIQAGNRCAVWQEEGAIFTFMPTPDFQGEVHYAEKPVVKPYSFTSWKVAMPVAVVHDGQTLAEVLPDMDNVELFYHGMAPQDTYIAVAWDISPYQTELDTRTRTVITGSYPDANTLHQPICLVVFQNGNPATFLDAFGMESYGWPKTKVKIELMEPELGCRFEWSQDGENWLSADAVETPSSDGRLAFTVSFPQETPPTYPYYLSAVVDYPDGSSGYSDVLVIEGADSQCGSGGNRHGGTGVTPPELPPLDGGMDGAAPEEPDESGEPGGSTPPGDGVTDEPDGTPPAVTPPPENDRPEQSTPPTEEPEAPVQVTPLARTEPPDAKAPRMPPVTEPPVAAIAEPMIPHSDLTGERVSTSRASSVQPEPSAPAPPPAPDAASTPGPQATAGIREVLVQTVTEMEAPVRDEAAPRAKAAAQAVAGVVATGGIIALTMTWGSWSKRLRGLLRTLLKR